MMTYIVRLNLDIKGTKEDSRSVRFRSAAEVVRRLHSAKNKVVILSHRGRPEGFDKSLSLRPLKNLLEKALHRKIIFFDRFDFPLIREKIRKSAGGSIFMLENLRFLPGEQENDRELAQNLASLGDIFINNDFATAHRENASNVGITKLVQHRAGAVLTREIKVLSNAMRKPRHPLVLIIGGAKIADKMGVIKNLGKKADKILLGGGPANTVTKAAGGHIGYSIYEPEMLKVAKGLAKDKRVELQEDFVIHGGKIVDIGPKSLKRYSRIIKDAGMIIWSGPMGQYEKKAFAAGSYGIASAMASSRAFTIAGGGDTTEVIVRTKLENKIDLLSTGGSAMLEYLSGKKLPAIEALKK